MAVYTYSEARQKLALVLKDADAGEIVQILRRDGRSYLIVPESPAPRSPLDVPSVPGKVTTAEVVRVVREGRRRAATRKGSRTGG